MGKSKRSEEKKIWEEFEELSIECVRDCYCKNGTKLSATRLVKDNGYDATILCNLFQDDNVLSLIEAKLRSTNVGLRDIAATIIIGYNLGVYRIFFVINNYATPQFESEVERFQEKTNIKCTIVDKPIIEKWLKNKSHRYSSALLSYLKDNAKSKKDKDYVKKPNNKISFMQNNTTIQSEYTGFYESDRINTIIQELSLAIESKKNCIILGGEGCGKSVIISRSLHNDRKCYYIDMSNCLTTRSFAMKVLYSLWGMDIFNENITFNDEEIDAIFSYVGDEPLDKQTQRTLKFILNTDRTTFDERSDMFNYILLEYLKKILQLHSSDHSHLFYFYNLEKTNADVINFLRQFCLLLYETNGQFLLEIRTPVTDNVYFSSEKWDTEVELFSNIDVSAYTKRIPEFTEDESIDYLKGALNGLTTKHASIIINSVGTVPLFLHCAVEWLYNNKIVYKYPNNKVLVEKFIPFFESILPTQNLIFAEKWVECFMKRSTEYSYFFNIIYILDGMLPLELYDNLFSNTSVYSDIVISLEQHKIIFIKNNAINIAHQVFLEALKHCCSFFIIKRVAPLVLEKLKFKENKTDWERLKILDILYISEEWKQYIQEYESTILYLKNTYQFKLAYCYMKKTIFAYSQIAKSNFNLQFYNNYLAAIELYLQLSISLKYIGQPSEKQVIDQYYDVLVIYNSLSHKDNRDYELFNKYINSQYYFRNADYSKAKSYCEIVKDKKESLVSQENIELIGKLCIGHALTVKATEGYESAKNDFEDMIAIYPDSKLLEAEYLVHLSCMELDTDPDSAYKHTKQVIELFENKNMQLEYPLFHKYVDLAMELFFSKKYTSAKESANCALELAVSNGIIAEEGRAKNILSCCEYIQDGNIENAISLSKDSCFLLEKSYYIPYLWRSRINLATFYIKQKMYDDALPYIISCEKYLLENTKQKIISDINNRCFHSSREYIALLLIGVYYKKYYEKKYLEKIESIIDQETYYKHVNDIEKNKYPIEVFKNSSFLHKDTILIIG